MRGEAADADGVVRVAGLSDFVRSKVSTAVWEQEKRKQTPLYQVEGVVAASRLTLSTPGKTTVASESEPASDVLDTRGRLSLVLEPRDAIVHVDGAIRSGNPIVLNLGEEKEKVVELSVSAEGYRRSVQKVTVVRGVVAPLTVKLEKYAAPSCNGGDEARGRGQAERGSQNRNERDAGRASSSARLRQ